MLGCAIPKLRVLIIHGIFRIFRMLAPKLRLPLTNSWKVGPNDSTLSREIAVGPFSPSSILFRRRVPALNTFKHRRSKHHCNHCHRCSKPHFHKVVCDNSKYQISIRQLRPLQLLLNLKEKEPSTQHPAPAFAVCLMCYHRRTSLPCTSDALHIRHWSDRRPEVLPYLLQRHLEKVNKPNLPYLILVFG